MLLARCNNALMSGIIDSFFTSKYMLGELIEGEKKCTPLLKVRTETERNQSYTTYVLLAPRDPLEIDDVIGFVRLSLLVHYYELTSFWMSDI